jgi:transposase
MVTLGADCHKQSHTVVAVDEAGRRIGGRTVRATPEGHLEVLAWAEQWSQRRWALEDCRHVSRRLEQDLLRAGEAVARVSPKMMAGARRSAREPGKSDPIDALAVARAALREPELPAAQLEGPSRALRLLVDHRDDLVQERTRVINRLRWHLHELAPGFRIPARKLTRPATWRQVSELLGQQQGLVAELAREQLARIQALSETAQQCERRIAALTAPLAPKLLELEGCGILTAAKLVAETADVSRFRSRGRYARNNGSAPIPVSSGNQNRVRLNRGGNRQLNAALHRIAITQARLNGRGQAYLDKQMAAGHSKTEALRALRRRLSDEVYRRIWQDHLAARSGGQDLAA